MRLIPIVLIPVLLIACTHHRGPGREIASVEYPLYLEEINPLKSVIRLFPPEHSGHEDQLLFHFQFKNDAGDLADVDPEYFKVEHRGKSVRPVLNRISKGNYTVAVKIQDPSLKFLKFKFQDEIIPHRLVVNFKRPSKKHSSIVIHSRGDHKIVLRLRLKDKQGNKIDLGELPEIIVDKSVDISALRLVRKGVWEFAITYPEENVLFYLSVRANGVYLPRLFRFQHIEKY